METQVWTDGSYSEKTGHGGWAWVTHSTWNSGFSLNGESSGSMELRAILWAIREIPGDLVIYTDHQGYANILSKGRHRHMLKEWLSAGHRDRTTLHHGLLVLIFDDMHGRNIRFEHINGHSGDKHNERAHKLANNARLSV